MLNSLITGLRIAVASMVVCVGGYAGIVWAVGQTVTPFTANGSILTDGAGQVIGSRQIAQAFTRPEYVWPRPSAVDYDGAGAGGSNWSPTSQMVHDRGVAMVAAYGATAENPLPADLATASGAGLDPHISEAGALYQVARVAEARGVPVQQVEALIRDHARSPGAFLTGDRIVNVLDLNLALDDM
ncbi:MAG TPA: K(+)-transporting ATPase subunit C [Thiolinea sp.]|nr:K(+)-transporting ATPase subunit C [Thiolinea sp.]